LIRLAVSGDESGAGARRRLGLNAALIAWAPACCLLGTAVRRRLAQRRRGRWAAPIIAFAMVATAFVIGSMGAAMLPVRDAQLWVVVGVTALLVVLTMPSKRRTSTQ
jgi:peptidoglycan/LPS O-acetylase OafA/YrhL